MAEISIRGNTKVSTLKRAFRDEYKLMLDVKKGRSNFTADSRKTLAEIRDPKAPSGKSFKISRRMLVGNVEKKFKEMGVKVNIKKSRGGAIDNKVTLSKAAG